MINFQILQKKNSDNKNLINIKPENVNQEYAELHKTYLSISEDYEGLLIDIKQQMALNLGLRGTIIELQSTIEYYNRQNGNVIQMENNDLILEKSVTQIEKLKLKYKEMNERNLKFKNVYSQGMEKL